MTKICAFSWQAKCICILCVYLDIHFPFSKQLSLELITLRYILKIKDSNQYLGYGAGKVVKSVFKTVCPCTVISR